ncbi:MAG TPA: MFS transporter [Acidimicrobiales bacterium]|nr:MFS transporter [Acidimicrobiales bacterium]
MARGGALLRHRDFRMLWGGETVSQLGSQVSLLAIPLLAVGVLHATTFEMGLLTAASTAAFLVVGLPAGVWVDRLRRRRVMIVADLGRVAALGSIPIAYALGGLTLVQLFVVTLASGILTVFFDVAYQSYLPALVGREHLVEGNAKLTGSEQVAAVAGPSLAGGLVQLIGAAATVAVDAASFLVSAVAVGSIHTPEPKPEAPAQGHARVMHDIAEGLRFVFGNVLLRAIAATTATSNFFSGISAAVEVVFLVREVHASPGVIGLLFTMGGVGGVLGAFAAGPIAARLGGARATLLGIAGNVGGLLIPLTMPGAGLALFGFGLLIVSFFVVVYNVNQVSFRQRLCPDRLLGRMNATMRFVVWGVLPIGSLIGGLLGSVLGLRATLWIGMVGEVLAGIWLVASPMRTMRDFPSISGPPQSAAEPAG